MMFMFLVSLLGIALALRIFDQLVARNLFSRSEMTKIGTAYFASVWCLSITLPHTHLAMWSAVFAPLTILSMILFALVKQRAREFRRSFIEALSITLLKMKSGRSFRQSLAETIDESEARMRTKLSEIASVVVFSQHDETRISKDVSDKFVAGVIEELKKIDRTPHAASRRLKVFRDRLRLEDDFRHRSGQVLARIRAQSLVMAGLYFAVFAFMVFRFGWKPNAEIMSASLLFFVVGALWIWRGGRNLKWKV